MDLLDQILLAGLPDEELFSPSQAVSDFVPADISLKDFCRQAWATLEPGTTLQWAWIHELYCEYLEAVWRGQIPNLLINCPPRHLKSRICSTMFPAWCWTQSPTDTFLCLSYATSLAIDHNSERRLLIQSDFYQELCPIDLQMGKNRLSEFTNEYRGYMVARGLDGSITGVGGGTCLTGDTLVETEIGKLRLDHLVQLRTPPNVLSFNHDKKRFEYRRITASKISEKFEVGKLYIEGSKPIYCTPDHRFYVEREGYKRAEDLKKGDTLKRVKSDRSCQAVRSLQLLVCKGVLRILEAGKKRGRSLLLQQGLLCGGKNTDREQVKGALATASLLPVSTSKEPGNLQGEACKNHKDSGRASFRVSLLLKDLHKKTFQAILLLTGLCEYGSLESNEGGRQFKAQGKRCNLFDALRKNAPTYFRAGGVGLSDLQQTLQDIPIRQIEFGCSPRKRRSFCEHVRKLGGLVSFMSQEDSHEPAFSSFERLDREKTTVYDIQVEENHNFFANGILTHNCIIVDDPENPEKKVSPEVRKASLFKFRSYISNRKNRPDTPVIVFQQRCDQNDISNYIKTELAGSYEIVVIPQLESGNRTIVLPLSNTKIKRKEREPIDKSRYSLKAIEADRLTMGETAFQARQQQNPVPQEGEIIQWAWFRRYPLLALRPEEEFRMVIQSLDAASTDKKSSSYWALITAGITHQGHIKLINIHRKKYRYPEGKRAILRQYEEYEPSLLLVENKSSGIQLCQELEALPILAVQPESSKVLRAELESTAIEGGLVWVPSDDLPWVQAFEAEIKTFPDGANDQVDSLTQLLKWVRLSKKQSKVVPVGTIHRNI